MTDQLMARIHELLSLNESLLEKAHRIYIEKRWKTDAYGMEAINNDQHYANFKRDQHQNISAYRTIAVDEAKLNRLLDIRFKRIHRAMENVEDEGAFGTVLNIAYLLPENLHSDLRRNVVNDSVPINLPLNSEVERNALLLSLIDSITNSRTVRDDEREILTRVYHRLKGDEASLYKEA